MALVHAQWRGVVCHRLAGRPFCNYFYPDSIRYNLTSFLRVASVKREAHKVSGKYCDP